MLHKDSSFDSGCHADFRGWVVFSTTYADTIEQYLQTHPSNRHYVEVDALGCAADICNICVRICVIASYGVLMFLFSPRDLTDIGDLFASSLDPPWFLFCPFLKPFCVPLESALNPLGQYSLDPS